MFMGRECAYIREVWRIVITEYKYIFSILEMISIPEMNYLFFLCNQGFIDFKQLFGIKSGL